MQCPHCGNYVVDGTTYCPSCGAPQEAPAAPVNPYANPNPNPNPNPYGAPAAPYGQPNPYANPNPYGAPAAPYGNPYGGGYAQPKPSVGFGEAVKLYFTNYANFSGRSRRSEYWYVMLFEFLVGLVLGLLPALTWIWSIATFIPSLALSVRRLHDLGKSGWWLLIALIPLVGSIILLVWECTDSDPRPNQYGPSPKYS